MSNLKINPRTSVPTEEKTEEKAKENTESSSDIIKYSDTSSEEASSSNQKKGEARKLFTESTNKKEYKKEKSDAEKHKENKNSSASIETNNHVPNNLTSTEDYSQSENFIGIPGRSDPSKQIQVPSSASKLETSSGKTKDISPPPSSEEDDADHQWIKDLASTLDNCASDLTVSHQKVIEDLLRGRNHWAQELYSQAELTRTNEEKDLKSWTKWLKTFAGGSVTQWTSFGVAMELAISSGNPWVFLLAAGLNEAFSEKAAALIRSTTFVTPDNKKLLRKQRLIARAVGDQVRKLFFLPIMERYTTDNPEFKTQRFSAAEALMKDKDRFMAITSYNLLNRGAPFHAFTATYIARDFLLASGLLGKLSPTAMIGLRLGAGGIAGGLTALISQFITSKNKDAKEVATHSTSYWRRRENYLVYLKSQLADLFNQIEYAKITNNNSERRLKQALVDFDEKLNKEIALVSLRKSKLTAFSAEIKQSLEKKRDLTSIDPENPGSRAESMFNALGKLISLIYFTSVVSG